MKGILVFLSLIAVFSCTNPTAPAPPPEVRTPVPDSMFCATIARLQQPPSAVGVTRLFWKNGQEVKIKFIGGSTEQRKYVADAFLEWSKYANLRFTFVTSGKTDCRISFDAGDGSWSYIGSDNASIPATRPTMNIGWKGLDVCLHEIGHFLGLSHEQGNPNGGICWNKDNVIKALSGPPNNWTKEMIEYNVFAKSDPTTVQTTPFDRLSIMQYYVPDSWVCDGKGIPGGTQLSASDKAFISGIYPKTEDPKSGGIQLTEKQRLEMGGNLTKSDSLLMATKKMLGL